MTRKNHFQINLKDERYQRYLADLNHWISPGLSWVQLHPDLVFPLIPDFVAGQKLGEVEKLSLLTYDHTCQLADKNRLTFTPSDGTFHIRSDQPSHSAYGGMPVFVDHCQFEQGGNHNGSSLLRVDLSDIQLKRLYSLDSPLIENIPDQVYDRFPISVAGVQLDNVTIRRLLTVITVQVNDKLTLSFDRLTGHLFARNTKHTKQPGTYIPIKKEECEFTPSVHRIGFDNTSEAFKLNPAKDIKGFYSHQALGSLAVNGLTYDVAASISAVPDVVMGIPLDTLGKVELLTSGYCNVSVRKMIQLDKVNYHLHVVDTDRAHSQITKTLVSVNDCSFLQETDRPFNITRIPVEHPEIVRFFDKVTFIPSNWDTRKYEQIASAALFNLLPGQINEDQFDDRMKVCLLLGERIKANPLVEKFQFDRHSGIIFSTADNASIGSRKAITRDQCKFQIEARIGRNWGKNKPFNRDQGIER